MVKVTVLYGHPADPEAFEEYYAGTHLPLVAKMPNVRRFEAARVIPGLGEEGPSYHRIAEFWFESVEQMQEALSSEEGRAAVEDIPNFATGGATPLFSVVD